MAKKSDDDIDPQFEEEAVDFVNEEDVKDADEDLPEDVKKASKADLYKRVKDLEEKAQSVSDPTDRISSAFESAVSKMRPAEPVVLPQAGESESDFRNRLKKDLFDEDKAEGVLNELIDRRLGPKLAQTAELNFKQAEKIMELDPETGPIFKKYRGEITTYIKANFAQFAKDPRALELAFQQVKVAHIDEIAQERANAILDAERKKTPARREPVQMETGSGPSGGLPAPRKIQVVVTQEDRRIADESGVDANEVAASRMRRRS